MAELAGLPLAALIFLFVIIGFLGFLVFLFMCLNKMACFANCGGCPCIEEDDKKKKKQDTQAILDETFGYQEVESSSDSEDETILRYQQSLLPPASKHQPITKKLKKPTAVRIEGIRTEDVEQGEGGSGTSSHTDHGAYEAQDDDAVHSELVDDMPLVGSEDEGNIMEETLPPDASPSIGDLELAFQYNGEARRMNVTVIKCHGLPIKSDGGASSWRLRLLLLPSKRQRAKTHIRESQDPLFKELFRFSRIFPHEVVSTALRCRLYTAERLRKERLVGESVIKFSSLNIANKQIIKVKITSRSETGQGGSPYSSTSDLSDSSTSSMQSLSRGSVPELLVGLCYNANTGRLDVEVIKGSHFKQRAAGRAPDSYVKVALMSSSGFEISKSKTSVRRGQSGPTFKETFFFQVAQFQLPEMTLLFSVFNKKGIKRKESIGWFSMGLSNSSEEEIGHWNEMRESRGHQVCRWHALLES